MTKRFTGRTRTRPPSRTVEPVHLHTIFLYHSANNTLVNNNVSENGLHGIRSWDSSNNTLGNNTAASNIIGIFMLDSGNNTVGNNSAASNAHGIRLEGSSHNVVSNNILVANDHGISLHDSSFNTFWHNEIAGNSLAQANCTTSTNNTWDNGTRGNYWGDYTARYPGAVQSGGIWDTPYTIQACQDRFPLVYKPVEPTNVSATAGNGNVSLIWDPPAAAGISGITRYSVYQSADNSTFDWLADIDATETTYVHEALDNSQTVYYRVTASNDRGEGLFNHLPCFDMPAHSRRGRRDAGERSLVPSRNVRNPITSTPRCCLMSLARDTNERSSSVTMVALNWNADTT